MISRGAASENPRSPSESRELALRRFAGACAVRIIDGGNAHVPEHAHDGAVLSLYLAGEVRNRTDCGVVRIGSPAAIFYRAGDAHENSIGPAGFEQVQIEFDPAWLRAGKDIVGERPRSWIGGEVALAATSLARLWSSSGASEAELELATSQFFAQAMRAPLSRHPPPWVDIAARRLHSARPPSTGALAGELGLHAGWMAEAYRRAVGEGVAQTARRRRVEVAAGLLRTTAAPAAEIAATAGFCDQSHMIRAFRAVLGRTPAQVRAEWLSDDGG